MRVIGSAVSADLFPTLRRQAFHRPAVRPRLTINRVLRARFLLSYRLWQTRFGGDTGVIGRQVLLDAEGVHRAGRECRRTSGFPTSEATFWTPLRLSEEAYVDRNDNWMYAVGRLGAGISVSPGQGRNWTCWLRHPERSTRPTTRMWAPTLVRFSDEVSEQSRLLLYALSGAAVCVLLIRPAPTSRICCWARALQRASRTGGTDRRWVQAGRG